MPHSYSNIDYPYDRYGNRFFKDYARFNWLSDSLKEVINTYHGQDLLNRDISDKYVTEIKNVFETHPVNKLIMSIHIDRPIHEPNWQRFRLEMSVKTVCRHRYVELHWQFFSLY